MVTLLITLDPKTFASLQNLKKESEFPTNFILFKDNIQLSQNENENKCNQNAIIFCGEDHKIKVVNLNFSFK